MIQDPRPGDVIAEIPGRGPLVRELQTLRALFADLLAQGSVVELGGARRILWKVDGMSPLRATDPRVRAAADRLGVSVTASRACSDRFATLLRERPGASEIAVPAELLKELSGAERGEARLQRRQVEFLRDLTRLAAEAVDEAVGRGDFVGDAQRVLLVGWGFLPPPQRRGQHRKPIEVSLHSRSEDVAPGTAPAAWRLAWSVDGPATAVELFAAGPEGGGPAAVPGTRRVCVETPALGEWDVPGEALAPGSVVHAVAAGASGVARSSPVQLGAAPVPQPPPLPAVPAADDYGPPVDLPAPDRGPSRRLVLVGLAALLVLAAAFGTFLAFKLNPSAPTFVRAEMLFASPALPPSPRPLDARADWGLGEAGTAPPASPAPPARRAPADADRAGRGAGGADAAPGREAPPLVGDRRIAEFEVGLADRVVLDPVPDVPPRTIPEFRINAPDYVAFDAIQRHGSESDTVFRFPADGTALAESADEGLSVFLGIEVTGPSERVLEWARRAGLRVDAVAGGRALLLADSARPFHGEPDLRDGGVRMSWGESWIEAWGIGVRPVVAIRSDAPSKCGGRVVGPAGVKLDAPLELEDGRLVAWPVIVPVGTEVALRFEATECNVRTREFRFRGSRGESAP